LRSTIGRVSRTLAWSLVSWPVAEDGSSSKVGQEEGGVPDLVPQVAAFNRGGTGGADELGSGDGFEKQQVARLWDV
jgi:hypothetical protein